MQFLVTNHLHCFESGEYTAEACLEDYRRGDYKVIREHFGCVSHTQPAHMCHIQHHI